MDAIVNVACVQDEQRTAAFTFRGCADLPHNAEFVKAFVDV